MTASGMPAGATSTTLRAPPKALVVGHASAEVVRRVQGEGYYVHTAEQAELGLEKLRAAHFDLLLLDVAVAGMGAARFVELPGLLAAKRSRRCRQGRPLFSKWQAVKGRFLGF